MCTAVSVTNAGLCAVSGSTHPGAIMSSSTAADPPPLPVSDADRMVDCVGNNSTSDKATSESFAALFSLARTRHQHAIGTRAHQPSATTHPHLISHPLQPASGLIHALCR